MIASVALAADELVLLVLTGESHEGRVNNSSTKTEHEVKGRLCDRHERSVRNLNEDHGS